MPTQRIVFTALAAALIAVGAYVAVPVGPVPVTLQTLFLITVSLLGGFRIALSASLLYLLMGAVGLPVFSGGTGGIAHFFSPTGGYLIGMVPAACIAGFFGDQASCFRNTSRTTWLIWALPGALLASLVIYMTGVPWLKASLGITWAGAAAAGIIPFIIGDVLKIAASLALAWIFSDRASLLLSAGRED